MYKPIIIAHHGPSAYEKGDVLRSFEGAMRSGADMVEFDLRRTRDGVFVAYHDRFIDGKQINELTYSGLELAAKSDRKEIPRIDEILKLTKSKIRIDVELKEEGYETEVIAFLGNYLDKDEFVITSFHDSSLRRIKTNFPQVRVGLLLGKPRPENLFRTRISELFPTKRSEKAKTDFLVPHFKLLRFGFLDRAQRMNQPVFVWTVNDEKMMARFLSDNRVEALITDKPDVAVEIRERLVSPDSDR
ncbi:MAG: glycerophosphodiester phosphodiesterase [Proteobacteria bacterium]|nr:glycerophosphodiester phosphodiesterase [Pseudomonadota bacterium]NIS71069.1 glycerophosphodiester phosphodiesterase [Pseudomonadota bacterium]